MPRDEIAWSRRIALATAVIFAVVDFLPTYGPPFFRYTGSDPDFHVWNLGWPIALAIYDSRSGLHTWPFTAVLLIQILILLAILVIDAFLYRRRIARLSATRVDHRRPF